jgi:class 3 adenylate cyclase
VEGARPQWHSLDEPDERRQLPGIQLDFVRVGDLFASRSITEPGWRWTTHIGPIAGTGSCQVAHRGIVISGHMRIEMDSGEVLDLGPGVVHIVPAGHDAWVIGDEPVVIIDSSTTSLEFGRPAAGERILATLLFTDIVGSTPLAQRLGDQRWKRLIAEHDRVTSEAIDRFRGHVVQRTGDGVFARFDGAARALHAAVAVRSAAAGLDLHVRIGLHTGEIEVTGSDVRGVAIHEAARIMALAGSDEILLSDLTRQLATGADLKFEDRGEVELRGVSGTHRMFALVANEARGRSAGSELDRD